VEPLGQGNSIKMNQSKISLFFCINDNERATLLGVVTLPSFRYLWKGKALLFRKAKDIKIDENQTKLCVLNQLLKEPKERASVSTTPTYT